MVIVTDVEDGGHGDATHVHDQKVADLRGKRLPGQFDLDLEMKNGTWKVC